MGKRLENVTGIIIHFNLKIGEWLMQHPHETITTSEQVMAIIEANYATLQLVSNREFLGEGNLYVRIALERRTKSGGGAEIRDGDEDEEGAIDEDDVEVLTRSILLREFGERYVQIQPVPPSSVVGQ